MMVFKGYYFNIFVMYEVPLKNTLFNKTVNGGKGGGVVTVIHK